MRQILSSVRYTSPSVTDRHFWDTQESKLVGETLMRLELANLGKQFGSKVAVNRISFVTLPGEIIALLGPNGAGKSTTIKMLVGLIEPTEGRILWDNTPIESDLISYKRRIGYVPEEPLIYPYLSGVEYLQLVGHLRGIPPYTLDSRIQNLLRLFDLFPARHRPIAGYSKGMKQKVLLCGALMHNPEILVLDEPLSGLDVTAVLVLQRLLKKLAASGKIIIYSTHILETVEKLCSKVIIIHQGSLVADTGVEELQRLKENPTLEQVFSNLALDQNPDEIAELIVGALE